MSYNLRNGMLAIRPGTTLVSAKVTDITQSPWVDLSAFAGEVDINRNMSLVESRAFRPDRWFVNFPGSLSSVISFILQHHATSPVVEGVINEIEAADNAFGYVYMFRKPDDISSITPSVVNPQFGGNALITASQPTGGTGSDELARYVISATLTGSQKKFTS